MDDGSPALLLGPMLRHVSETSAAIWVETSAPAEVTVTVDAEGGPVTARARTFTVHGGHYAVCELTGLPPGTSAPYTVELDGSRAWPEAGAATPPSLLRTLSPGGTRLAFGSCRTTTGHDAEHTRRYGVDMLRAYALRLASGEAEAPHLLLMIGDQVYADELQPEMLAYIAEHRPPHQGEWAPDDEIVEWDEYVHLYRLAWSDPWVRWLLSTVPSLMMFDDHDVRDDWNTSAAWREKMAAQPWWRDRITHGLGTYWLYQHLGNMSPEERAVDPVYTALTGADGDAGAALDDFAWEADQSPERYRWSYALDLPSGGGGSRLVMLDTRCGRVLSPESARTMHVPADQEWLEKRLTGGVDHVLIATTLPYLLPTGIHHLEAWNEAVCRGAWGERWRRIGEKLRQDVDLEHWAAFQASFRQVGQAVRELAEGSRGEPPATVLFLSGDVHFSYVADARARLEGPRRTAPGPEHSRIAQIVCSPMRNPLSPKFQAMAKFAGTGLVGLIGRMMTRSSVPGSPLEWRITRGPWFDNSLATLELDGHRARVRWETADQPADDTAPVLRELGRHVLEG
ncbi:alkaline phosphatase D family protein [Allonocardiopsis opalescens]|uniref:PhoD-like phosphatase n=1 Tax=Allonocardiopsis opalescens TaxID=1144618 RepID=A0A2T0PUS9_9ACTN|nr:alkaline phosphatase D family protein [Allonocardiopsis opalescens]PRX92486.1 PhoD-like phosphatase [Allonocardiopsis opalescens]